MAPLTTLTPHTSTSTSIATATTTTIALPPTVHGRFPPVFFCFFFYLNWNFVEGFIAVVGKYFRARCLKCITAFWGAWNPSRSAANVVFQQLPANQLFILNFIYYLNFVEGSVFVNRR